MLVSRRIARRVGAGALAALVAGLVATVALSGRTLAPGFALHVDFERLANLRPGAKVQMGGRAVGEIVGVTLAPRVSFRAPQAAVPGAPEEPRLRVALRIQSRYRAFIHRNSEPFVNQHGVLGEQYLEIGPPRGAPGAVVADGDRLRGADPPRIDRLLTRGYDALQALTSLLHDLQPLGAELAQAIAEARAVGRQAGLDPARVRALAERAMTAVHEGRALALTATRGTHRGADLAALRAEIGSLGDRVGDDLRALGRDLDRLAARFAAAQDLWSPARRARLARAVAAVRDVLRLGEAIARDARQVVAMVERGEGTIGAFLHDRELWDDLHLIHQQLKDRPWRAIVRPRRPVRE